MDSGLLSLKWNHHNDSFQNMLSNIRSKVLFSDVTLACGGKLYPVHKLVLSTCSEYFEVMLQETQCKHPVIVLKDISCTDLDYLLDFMYIGEVNVPQTKLSTLIEAAECLRIRGLAVPDEPEQDDVTKSSPLRNEKSNVNSHLRTKRQKEEESPEGPHKKCHKSNDQVKHTKFPTVERNNNGDRTGASLPNQDDGPRTDMSLGDRKHLKNKDSRLEFQAVTIKEEYEGNSLQDHGIDLQEEMADDGTNSTKHRDYNTPACSVSEDNNRHHKSSGFDSSRLDFKEDMSQEFPNNYAENFDEDRSNGQQMNVSGDDDDDELQSLSFPSPSSQAPSYQRDITSLTDPLDEYNSFHPQQQPSFYGGDLSQLHESQASSAASSLRFLSDDNLQSLSALSNTFGSPHSRSAGAGATPSSSSTSSLGVLTTTPFIKIGQGPDSFKQCPFCPYKTQLTGNIKKHILGHTGCKPFACSMCTYRTNEKSNLNRHVRCHLLKASQMRAEFKTPPSSDA